MTYFYMIFEKIVKTSVLVHKHSQLLNLKPGKMECSNHAKIYGKQQINNRISWSINWL
jgi:hypothetical protein